MLSLHCTTSLFLVLQQSFNEHKSIAVIADLDIAIEQLVTKRAGILTVGESNLHLVICLVALVLVPVFEREINHQNPQ